MVRRGQAAMTLTANAAEVVGTIGCGDRGIAACARHDVVGDRRSSRAAEQSQLALMAVALEYGVTESSPPGGVIELARAVMGAVVLRRRRSVAMARWSLGHEYQFSRCRVS